MKLPKKKGFIACFLVSVQLIWSLIRLISTHLIKPTPDDCKSLAVSTSRNPVRGDNNLDGSARRVKQGDLLHVIFSGIAFVSALLNSVAGNDLQ